MNTATHRDDEPQDTPPTAQWFVSAITVSVFAAMAYAAAIAHFLN